MADTLNAFIVDVASGEITERAFTAKEIKDHEALQADFAKSLSEANAKSVARASALSKLEQLGLTADEVAAL